MNQSILLTGATGFVGLAVSARLAASGCRVLALRRTSSDAEAAPTWNLARRQIDLDPSQPLDAVVHLAGENIAQRWTLAAQERIRASRVDATRLSRIASFRAGVQRAAPMFSPARCTTASHPSSAAASSSPRVGSHAISPKPGAAARRTSRRTAWPPVVRNGATTDARTIFEEGVSIPPIKIIKAG